MAIRSAASFKYNSDSIFKGILHYSYFTSESFFLHSELKITASSYDIENIYTIIGDENPDFDLYFQTTNEENSWIQFEMNNIKIHVSDFVYRTRINDFHDKWQLLGSNNNKTFDILYEGKTEEYEETNDITDKHFNCNNLNCSNQYSYIRVLSNGHRRYQLSYKLALYGFELYGNVYNIFSFSLSKQNNFLFQALYFISIIIL